MSRNPTRADYATAHIECALQECDKLKRMIEHARTNPSYVQTSGMMFAKNIARVVQSLFYVGQNVGHANAVGQALNELKRKEPNPYSFPGGDQSVKPVSINDEVASMNSDTFKSFDQEVAPHPIQSGRPMPGSVAGLPTAGVRPPVDPGW